MPHTLTTGKPLTRLTGRRPLARAYRAILWVLMLSFLLLALHIWREVKTEVDERLGATTRQFAQMARAEFIHQEAMLRLLGSRLLDAGALDAPEKGRRLIEEMQRINPALAGYGLARPDGQLVLVSGVPAGRALPNLLDQEASHDGFLQALRASRMVVGRTYFFGLLRRWLIPVRLALRDGDRVRAVMAAGIDIDAPEALWNVMDVPPDMHVSLVRDDGYVQLRRPVAPEAYAGVYDHPVKWARTQAHDPFEAGALTRSEYVQGFGLSVVSAYPGGYRLRLFGMRILIPLALFLGILLTGYFFYRSACRSQKRYEAGLIHQATHDALTGLPNRHLIHDRLEREIAHAARQDGRFGVVYLDLDNFKQINDGFGHDAGDRLLQAVARRLQAVLREVDSLGRMGGDEFVVLMSELGEARDAEVLAQRLHAVFEQPFDLAGRAYFVTASIGIAVYPDDARDVGGLMSRADAALYRAKDRGRDCICFFEAAFDQEIERRTRLEQGLRQALRQGELYLLYQPKIDARSGRWVGAEALMRWHSRELGEVSPVEFIPVAEETGLIQALGGFALERALTDLRRIQQLAPDFQMAVNVSVRQFHERDFFEHTLDAVRRSGIDPAHLELEVTESIMARPIAGMERLREAGLQLAIDDFGTGFSSLGTLKRLPVTTLKIDREFVRDIETDPADKALVTAMIAVARELDLQVVAEGVETDGQTDYLRAQGCHLLQGFLFARPLSLDALLEGLAANHPQGG